MVIFNTKCNLDFSQHWGKGVFSAEQLHSLAAPQFHWEAPGQGTAWSLVSAFTLARPQQEAHGQRSSEMEITHELLMQIRRGQSK